MGIPRVNTSTLLTLVAVLAALGIGVWVGGRTAAPPVPASHEHAEDSGAGPTLWTCSMHPQIQLPEPGKCPICFMDLIPVDDGAGADPGPRSLALSAAAAALADIRTEPVVRGQAGVEVRLVGRVVPDETLTGTIAARIPGRIDTLFVDYTGAEVVRGQPLLSIYSPDLYAGQAELIQARTALAGMGNAAGPAREAAEATVTAARRRLSLWGLSDGQIDRIAAGPGPSSHLRILSPQDGTVLHRGAAEGSYVAVGSSFFTIADLSRVWVTLDAYESDLAALGRGQEVRFTVQALPGRFFTGAIAFIDPVLDERTRTVQVRLEAENLEGLLKPGMLVDAVASPAGGDGSAGVLLIPATAPLLTGKRAVVYVKDPLAAEPVFEGREIVLGPRAGNRYVVREGLSEGDLVVTNGAFKLDSALQIQAKPSMMSPPRGPAMAGHGHDDHPAAEPEQAVPAPEALRNALAQVVRGYLEIQAALAGDDDRTAASAAAATAAALTAADLPLQGDVAAAWARDRERIAGPLTRMSAAGDLAGRREPLQALTDAVWSVARRYGVPSDLTLRLFNCPMAYANTGGDWIQTDQVTANPYFGAGMLRCGSQTDTLAVMAGAEGTER